jgi:hypothetical protein
MPLVGVEIKDVQVIEYLPRFSHPAEEGHLVV